MSVILKVCYSKARCNEMNIFCTDDQIKNTICIVVTFYNFRVATKSGKSVITIEKSQKNGDSKNKSRKIIKFYIHKLITKLQKNFYHHLKLHFAKVNFFCNLSFFFRDYSNFCNKLKYITIQIYSLSLWLCMLEQVLMNRFYLEKPVTFYRLDLWQP